MNVRELCISSEGMKYQIRLVPQKIITRGRGKKRPTLAMVFSGIDQMTKRIGTLEACTTPEGKSLGDWKKVGTFTSEYACLCDPEVDALSICREFRERNMIIQVEEYEDYMGGREVVKSVMKTRNHWYEPWKTIPLCNLRISETV